VQRIVNTSVAKSLFCKIQRRLELISWSRSGALFPPLPPTPAYSAHMKISFRSPDASQRKQLKKYYSTSCRRKDFGSDSVCVRFCPSPNFLLPSCRYQVLVRRYGLCFNRLDPRFQVMWRRLRFQRRTSLVCDISLQNLFAACGGCKVNVYELQPQAKAMRPVQRLAWAA